MAVPSRLTVLVDPVMAADLARLQELLQGRNKTDLVRRALSWLKVCEEAQAAGGKVYLRPGPGEEIAEVILL